MTLNLYVLDTETTGLNGAPIDSVVEIGIARVDIDRCKVYPEWTRIINAPLTEQQKKEAWVFNNTDLTPDDCLSSPHFTGNVADELNIIYSGLPFTAYNRAFDFDMFLNKDPWNFRPAYLPCLMEITRQALNATGRWLKAQEAYDTLCPDNPAQLPEGREQHRALSDAVCEGWIMLRLFEKFPDTREFYESSMNAAMGDWDD